MRAGEGFTALGWPGPRDSALAVHGAAAQQPDQAPDDAAAGVAGLSRREREIAALVAHGHSNREIAEMLFLSTRTIDSHVGRILRKVGVRSRTAIANRLTTTKRSA
jgi:DNA-binding NarL/FixJ family response regulator